MSTMFSSKSRRTIAAIALVAVTGLSAAACGSSDDSSSSSSSKASAPKPVASIDSLTGNDTQIKLDQGFVDALTTLKLTPKVMGTAKLTDGSLIFPITGGNVTVFKPGAVSPYVIGQIRHEGSGLSLTARGELNMPKDDINIQLTNLNVDPGVSRVYGDVAVNGKVAATSAYLFKLDGRTLKPLSTGSGTATLEGTKVEISPVAATVLNDVFKTDAVKPGLLVGIAKITVNTTPGD